VNVISTAQMRELLSENNPEAYIGLLRIQHPSLANDLLLAYNTDTVHRTDGDYLPFPFELSIPDDTDDEIAPLQLTIDNASLEVSNQLRSIQGEPKVIFRVVLASEPDTDLAGPFYMNLKTSTGDVHSIKGSLSYEDDIWKQQVPAQVYSPANSKGMYV